MNKQKGFTLLELMISLAIIGIISILMSKLLFGGDTFDTKCKHGFLFSVDYNGNQQQMINEKGTAIQCT